MESQNNKGFYLAASNVSLLVDAGMKQSAYRSWERDDEQDDDGRQN
jgi:hypothetical protein